MKGLLLGTLAILLASPVAHSNVEETRTTLRQHVLKLINRDRQIYRLPPVQLDLQASAIGDEYCRAQIRNRTTGHYTTDGLSPYMRYSFAGGNDAVSENAAAWSASYAFNERALYEMARRSDDAMMAETPPNDGHKRTILDPHATHVGIGMAWERGEFRMVQEFLRRYIRWTRTPPRLARIGDSVIIAGRPIGDAAIEAITVHHEPLPKSISAVAASAIQSYSLPEFRKEYLPRLQSEYRRRADGSYRYVRREYADGRRGDFYLGQEGEFSFTVPFTEEAGVYTVVIWVRRPGFDAAISASSISIRVDAVSSRAERGSSSSGAELAPPAAQIPR